MSRELSLYEATGGTYKSVDGILYPNITCGSDDTLSVSITDVGKYGLAWISYMKENHADRYRHHIRMGQLHRKAQEVNEQAYEMLDSIMNRYLASHKPKDTNSTMEMWKLMEQAKQLAEEVIYGEIVYQYH
ncbi:MAG: TnpV protein [Agathobacter rectalis]